MRESYIKGINCIVGTKLYSNLASLAGYLRMEAVAQLEKLARDCKKFLKLFLKDTPRAICYPSEMKAIDGAQIIISLGGN